MSINNGKRPTVCIVAADVSADQNAARLAAALRRMAPQVRIIGAGGCVMRQAGIDVAVDSDGVSMVGPPDSLHALRSLARVWRGLTRLMKSEPPDVVILVDNETLNLFFARWARKRGVSTVFFFPPQVWFWGRWRLRWILPAATRVLSAFREEAELYRSAGADTRWIGHPLRDEVQVRGDPPAGVEGSLRDDAGRRAYSAGSQSRASIRGPPGKRGPARPARGRCPQGGRFRRCCVFA